MPEQPHELSQFLTMASEDVASEYRRIRQRSKEDPGTAGDEGEENWRKLLEEWLPKQYSVVTKGRILNPTGKLSPQLDVVILKPSYPTGLVGKKVYLADGVAAAFECKITLRKKNIGEVFEKSVALSNMLRRRKGTPYDELNRPIAYGLLAHSHDWGAPNEAKLKISEEIRRADLTVISRPSQMPDMFCVADVGTWLACKTWFTEGTNHTAKCNLATFYSVSHLTGDAFHSPIGRFMAKLLRCLAWRDVPLREIADYFEAVPNMTGSGNSVGRMWPESTLSEETLKGIAEGRRGRDRWDSWSRVFP